MDEKNATRKYNGWTNYETWAVKLWLDNEEHSYRYWTDLAQTCARYQDGANRLASTLRDEVTEQAPELGASLFSDLLSAALAEVDWYELASSFLDDVDEEPESCDGSEAEGSELFGEVIFAYTRAEALDDGVLVDVSETAQEAGYIVPVALTRAVWAEYVAVPEGVSCQDEAGRLWDVLWMSRHGIMSGQDDASERLFQLHVRNDNRTGTPPLVTLKAVCGPDDEARPCITIMRPDED